MPTMSSLGLLLWILIGIGLQVGLFAMITLWQHWQSYKKLQDPQAQPNTGTVSVPVSSANEHANWQGWRKFKVIHRVIEDDAGQIVSFYLQSEDGEPLPAFKPGQFLTFRLHLTQPGGGTQSIVRCYSLSEAPQKNYYRISVKRVQALASQNHSPGLVSHFFHDHLQAGAVLEVKAPTGHFYLEAGTTPVVLIAGGIGITPLLSMLNWCQLHQPEREIWLFYGVRNSQEMAFAAHLNSIQQSNPNFHLRWCFSAPLPEDEQNKKFHHRGRIDANLLRLQLPFKTYDYYICASTAMMESVVQGLTDWGVADANIHFEAFGPASVSRRHPIGNTNETPVSPSVDNVTVTFARSKKTIPWSSQFANLLQFAESQGVAIDAGCRSGCCGACQTSIKSGQVNYLQPPDLQPQAGTCLMCVCTPKTHLTLEA